MDALALSISAVGIGTAAAVVRAVPGRQEFFVGQTALIAFLLIVQVLPIGLLAATDVGLHRRSHVWHSRFRYVLLGVPAVFLALHGLGGSMDGGGQTGGAGARSALIFVVVGAPLALAILLIVRRYRSPTETVYRFLLPAAMAPSILLVINHVPPTDADWTPRLPSAAPATSERQPFPTTFVLVFDELAYQSLLNEEGAIDATRFPNLAALSSESAQFTDASAHRSLSVRAVPSLIEPIVRLADQADVKLYVQYAAAETPFHGGCGERYACVGASLLARERESVVLRQLILSYNWHLIPGPLREAAQVPREWLGRVFGQPQSTFDPRGLHLFTDLTFDAFLQDVANAEPQGQVFFLHTLTSHFPYIRDREGNVVGGVDLDFWTRGVDDGATFERHLQQIEYADARLGELLGVLRGNGRFDDSVVILTADHGLRRHSVLGDEAPDVLPREVTSIPLLIRGPSVEARIYDASYSHEDFEATLRDVLQLTPSPSGVSAFEGEGHDGVLRFVVDSWLGWTWYYEREAGGVWRLVRTEDRPSPN